MLNYKTASDAYKWAAKIVDQTTRRAAVHIDRSEAAGGALAQCARDIAKKRYFRT
jgi:hypothetical protein